MAVHLNNFVNYTHDPRTFRLPSSIGIFINLWHFSFLLALPILLNNSMNTNESSWVTSGHWLNSTEISRISTIAMNNNESVPAYKQKNSSTDESWMNFDTDDSFIEPRIWGSELLLCEKTTSLQVITHTLLLLCYFICEEYLYKPIWFCQLDWMHSMLRPYSLKSWTRKCLVRLCSYIDHWQLVTDSR